MYLPATLWQHNWCCIHFQGLFETWQSSLSSLEVIRSRKRSVIWYPNSSRIYILTFLLYLYIYILALSSSLLILFYDTPVINVCMNTFVSSLLECVCVVRFLFLGVQDSCQSVAKTFWCWSHYHWIPSVIGSWIFCRAVRYSCEEWGVSDIWNVISPPWTFALQFRMRGWIALLGLDEQSIKLLASCKENLKASLSPFYVVVQLWYPFKVHLLLVPLSFIHVNANSMISRQLVTLESIVGKPYIPFKFNIWMEWILVLDTSREQGVYKLST